SPAAATWQLPIGQPLMTWQPRQRRPTPASVSQRRSTPPATGQRRRGHGGDRRTTVAVNDGRRWRTTVDFRWTTVDHHQTTGQRWLVGRSTSRSGSGLAGSRSGRVRPGLGRVQVGSAT
nr:hypothetical protein [Tanacetum cinerariifolium]